MVYVLKNGRWVATGKPLPATAKPVVIPGYNNPVKVKTPPPPWYIKALTKQVGYSKFNGYNERQGSIISNESITYEELAAFLVRANINGYIADDTLTDIAQGLEDAARGYSVNGDAEIRKGNGDLPLPASREALLSRDSRVAANIYEYVQEEIAVLVAVTAGPHTGGTDGIDDMAPVLVKAITNGYIDPNGINYTALTEQLNGRQGPAFITDPDGPDNPTHPDDPNGSPSPPLKTDPDYLAPITP